MIRFEKLTDGELLRRSDALARAERVVTAEFVACLGEIERRGVHLDMGYCHLFDFCVRRLRLSEGAAGRRVAAAHAARKRVEVLTYLKDGAISLWALCRIEPFLQEDDGSELLARASCLDRARLEALVLELRARAAQRRPEPADEAPEPQAVLFSEPPAPAQVPAFKPPSPDRVVAPSPGRVRFSFEAAPSLKSKLERLSTLLHGRLKSYRLEALIETIADLAISRLDPLLKKTRRAKPVTGNPRKVPWAVRREVLRRDEGRCAFRGEDGTRCASGRPLQYDHIVPWSYGGRSDDPANIRLLCRAHNLLLARRLFPAARLAARRAGATSSAA